MADTPAKAPDLSDFFAKKSKKKIKATNLNTATNTAKPEESQKKKATEEEDEWKEEEVATITMQVAAAGKLMREEEKQDSEEAAACRWKPQSNKEVSAIKDARDEKRFPTLSRATKSSNITIGENEATVNIKTSVNVFATLMEDGDDSDEDDAPKKPSSIAPARVQKKKGERETAAIEREKEKYGVADKPTKKKIKKEKDADEEDDEDDEDAEEEAEEAEAPKRKKKKAKEEVDEEKPESEDDKAEDLKIVPDMEACKAKYEDRKKPFPPKPLPRSEMQEEKENRPKQQVGGGKKKKKGGMAGFDDEEDNGKKKLQEVYAWNPDDEED